MTSYIEQQDQYWIVKDDEGLGNALVLKTTWSPRFLDLITKYRVRIIRLNQFTGWSGSDVKFLLDVPGIVGVDILSDNVTDVSPVFEMTGLRSLSLHCKAGKAGDFTKLPKLRSVGLSWRNVYESVLNCDSLSDVNIIRFPYDDLKRWHVNKGLEMLRVESAQLKAIEGIERFTSIKQLRLFQCTKLTSLEPLAAAASIEKLSIKKCRGIVNLSPVALLVGLKELEMEDCGEIESLSPILSCKKLEQLRIAGNTTLIDGNIGELSRLRRLKSIFITPHKHYSHTDEEL